MAAIPMQRGGDPRERRGDCLPVRCGQPHHRGGLPPVDISKAATPHPVVNARALRPDPGKGSPSPAAGGIGRERSSEGFLAAEAGADHRTPHRPCRGLRAACREVEVIELRRDRAADVAALASTGSRPLRRARAGQRHVRRLPDHRAFPRRWRTRRRDVLADQPHPGDAGNQGADPGTEQAAGAGGSVISIMLRSEALPRALQFRGLHGAAKAGLDRLDPEPMLSFRCP